MKFLHTSDWHIGKKLNKRSRLDEQREVLEELIDICDRESIDIVLVAGDVFDTYVPSSDAEDLFYDIVSRLARDRAVVIISGNHDDATRLCAPIPMAKRQGVYICGNLNEANGYIDTQRRIKLIESGEGYFVFESEKSERVFINVLPYPNEVRFKENIDENETFEDKMKRWLSKGFEANKCGYPSILMSHIFMVGSITSNSEREIGLGGARAVGKDIMPDCLYTALGHIHKRQVMSKSKNIIYSGSILQYAFDESGNDKSVTVFEINGGKCENIRKVKFTKGKKLISVEYSSVEEAISGLKELGNGYFIELNLKIGRPITESENKEIASANPNIAYFNLITDEKASQNGFVARGLLGDKDLFIEYYKSKYSKEPDDDILSLYLEFMNEEDIEE